MFINKNTLIFSFHLMTTDGGSSIPGRGLGQLKTVPSRPTSVPVLTVFGMAGAKVEDAVNTGDPAAVGVSFDGTNMRFTFDIPRGNDGKNGSNGSHEAQGPLGKNERPERKGLRAAR
jgi:hypothetical protein